MSEVASNYANALLSIAKDKDCVLEIRNEIFEINKAFKDVKELKVFFQNVNISKDEKKELLEASFKEKINQLTLNFLKVLVDKNRMNEYEEIFKEFRKIANKELNIKEGVIESKRPLDAKQIKTLEDALGTNVELVPRINESLISGFKIIFDNQIIDNSMKNKISELNSLLLERR